MRAIALVLFVLAFALQAADSIPTIAPEAAKDHVGKPVTVRGVITQVSTTKGGHVFINFGGKYPDQVFTVFLHRGFGGIKAWKGYEGKLVEVAGTIRLYHDKPEIVGAPPQVIRSAGL